METSITYSSDTAFFSSDERKWITKIRKLKEQHPDEITILAEPETNDGCIYCKLPAYTLKIQFKREMSEEEKETRRNRMLEQIKSGNFVRHVPNTDTLTES